MADTASYYSQADLFGKAERKSLAEEGVTRRRDEPNTRIGCGNGTLSREAQRSTQCEDDVAVAL
jgi:hypothetical protein